MKCLDRCGLDRTRDLLGAVGRSDPCESLFARLVDCDLLVWRESDVGELSVQRRAELGGDDRADRRDRQEAGDASDRVVDAGSDAGVVLFGV